jgi:hypothetical protein
MLYDQAQLVLAYLEAAQATADDFYATVAEDTLDYVLRDLTDPGGGFYSAEDADSIPPEQADDPRAHKSEGAFYIWSDAEIASRLGEHAEIARRRFGIQPDGNALQDPQEEFKGRNLLYISEPVEDIAIRTGKPVDHVMNALVVIREKLFAARQQRPRPHLDDKVLTAWNGLMIAAFARAARVANPRHLQAAQRAAEFIRTTLWIESERRLLRRYRAGEAAIDAYAEDYAYLVFGLLELFQADGDVRWLDWAVTLQQRQDDLFWDPDEAGWFSTTGNDPTVLLRLKEDYDGAEPAASSVSVLNLLTLENLIGGGAWAAKAERTLARLGPRIGAAARVVPMMLAGLSSWHAEHSQVVIVGSRASADTDVLRRTVGRRYLPFALVIPVAPGADQDALAVRLPFVGAMRTQNGHATAYVCRAFTCREPVRDADALAAQLAGA